MTGRCTGQRNTHLQTGKLARNASGRLACSHRQSLVRLWLREVQLMIMRGLVLVGASDSVRGECPVVWAMTWRT